MLQGVTSTVVDTGKAPVTQPQVQHQKPTNYDPLSTQIDLDSLAYQCSRIYDYHTHSWVETGVTKEDIVGKKPTIALENASKLGSENS
jgi:hypothetical protein